MFPKVTQLDMTGPLQVFSSLPGAKVHLIWKRIEPVAERLRADADAHHDLCGLPAARRDLRPRRRGTDDMVNDAEMLDFLRGRRHGAKSSPRSARDRWCWARPACCRVIARRRMDGDGVSSLIRRDTDQNPRLRRPQPRHRRRRHRGNRFCADAGVAPVRPPDRGSYPARARINPAPPFIQARPIPRRRKF